MKNLQIRNIKMQAIRQALDEIAYRFGQVRIFTIQGDTFTDRNSGKCLQLGVNWAACGTQTVKETMAFVEILRQAAEVCNAVNKLNLDPVVTDRDAEYTVEQFKKEVKAAMKLLELGDVEYLMIWLEKEVQ